MSVYTYYVTDVKTGQLLGDLPFSEVTIEWALSGAGTFTGKLALSDPDVIAMGGNDLTKDEGRYAVHVDLDGTLIWSGILWDDEFDSEAGQLTLNAADYWSFFSRRIAGSDINLTSADIITIVDAIFDLAMTTNLPYGLSIVYSNPPDVAWTPTAQDYVYASTERKTVAELIEGLAGSSPGFDFRVRSYWFAANDPRVEVLVGRPYLGRSVVSTGAFFDFPGNITKYTEARSGNRRSGKVYVKGNSETDVTPEVVIEDTSLYTTLPKYERAEAVDETNPVTLAQRAQYIANQRKVVELTYVLTVRPDATPGVQSYNVGDFATVRLTDARHPVETVLNLRIAHKKLDVDKFEVEITPWQDTT